MLIKRCNWLTIAFLLLACVVMALLHCCSFNADTWLEHVPATWGRYEIDTIMNEVGLIRLYPEAEHSGCGLANDDFVKYATSRINRKRQFQFIVFTDGKPAVGERCFRKAFIFYLKEK